MKNTAQYSLKKVADNTLVCEFYNDWTKKQSLPSIEFFFHQLDLITNIRKITYNTDNLGQWDSLLILFLEQISNTAKVKSIHIDNLSLPNGMQNLLKLAHSVPRHQMKTSVKLQSSFLTSTGESIFRFFSTLASLNYFLIEVVNALGKYLTGQAQYRRTDLLWFIQDSGIQSLPVVSLISFLMGIILAFLGAMQLALLGVEIYVSNLVAVGMTREMAPLMTAIIMAGRSGASFSSQLGSMQINEEIDAFKTLGISPVEFLVLPRMLGLLLMLPILTFYADLLGILGGLLVSTSMFDFSVLQYIHQTAQSITLIDIFIGIFKAFVFAFLIAFAGCFHGYHCSRSSDAVGIATTRSVVMSIVSIVIADSIITVTTTLIWKISIVT